MAFLQVDYYSNELGRGTQLSAILPDGGAPEGGFPTLYLLHGMSGNYSVWSRRTSIERYADEKRLAVIMPDARTSWYTDTAVGERYFAHISDELVALSHWMFPGLSALRERTFVAGLSMGGYGALRCALKRPDVFSKAAMLSGGLDVAALPGREDLPERREFWEDVFGPAERIAGSEADLFRAAEELKEGRPALWQWCGTEDFLYRDNLRMRDHLRALGYDLTYSECSGDHEWRYWDAHIQRALDWMLPAEEVSAWL